MNANIQTGVAGFFQKQEAPVVPLGDLYDQLTEENQRQMVAACAALVLLNGRVQLEEAGAIEPHRHTNGMQQAIYDHIMLDILGMAEVTAEATRSLMQHAQTFMESQSQREAGERLVLSAGLGVLPMPDINAAGVRMCTSCCCTDEDACAGGCRWVSATLCSKCASPPASA